MLLRERPNCKLVRVDVGGCACVRVRVHMRARVRVRVRVRRDTRLLARNVPPTSATALLCMLLLRYHPTLYTGPLIPLDAP
jgi:hypothetical protein